MVIKAKLPASGERRQYLVKCDDCPFEEPVRGREPATRVGTEHRLETGHDIVAVEMPRSWQPA